MEDVTHLFTGDTMKTFEEDMCRNCSEYEYSDDCKQCELDWYKEKYKTLLNTSDSGYTVSPTATHNCLYGFNDCMHLGILCEGCRPVCYCNKDDIHIYALGSMTSFTGDNND